MVLPSWSIHTPQTFSRWVWRLDMTKAMIHFLSLPTIMTRAGLSSLVMVFCRLLVSILSPMPPTCPGRSNRGWWGGDCHPPSLSNCLTGGSQHYFSMFVFANVSPVKKFGKCRLPFNMGIIIRSGVVQFFTQDLFCFTRFNGLLFNTVDTNLLNQKS